jgi:hypothetical protein
MNLDQQTQFNLAEVQETISELQSALLSAHPEMPIILRKIHTKLKADPAIVTLLTEDEIAQVINGLKVQTNVSLTSPKAAAKPKTASAKLKDIIKSSNISADDF